MAAIHDQESSLKAALIDRYAIQGEVSSGGMATVFLAEDLKHGRKVAIKVLKPELASSVGAERFLREIQIAANLSHPHVLPLYDSGEADGQLYYVMPFVQGESLRDRLKRERQLPIEDALKITGQVAAALGHAHEQGVVHRDIKPENILLAGDEALVADFGIAGAVEVAGGERLTATGMAIGTPAYMSPEQAGGGSGIDPRSDIYSLGCVLYEMLLGDPPFMGSTADAILVRKLTEPVQRLIPVRETIPAGVEHVTLKALSRLPVDRYKTATEFAVELERAPTLEIPEKPGGKSRSRTKRIVAGTTALVVALFAWLVFGPSPDGSSLPRLAVLLPADIPEDPDQESWVQAVHDGVNIELTKLGLPVKARESMMRFRNATVPPKEMADDLGVDVFIGLSVSSTVDSALVDALLIDGETEEQSWAGSYTADVGNLPRLVSSIAGGLARTIQGGLRPEQEARLTQTRQVDPRAFREYLTGVNLTRTRTAESVEAAKQHLLRSIEMDSTFAPAVAWLSAVYHYQGMYHHDFRPEEVFPQAQALALRAIELDSTVAEAHGAMAFVHRQNRDWEEEGKSWERAIALDPQKYDLHAGYAYWLQNMSRFEEAIEEFKIAVDLEPLHFQYNSELARMYHFGRRFDEAIEQFHRAVDLDPVNFGPHLFLALTYVQAGRVDEAIASALRSAELDPNDRAAGFPLAYAYAAAGRVAEARAILEEWEALAYEQTGRPRGAGYAIAYGALGEIDRAFTYLENEFDQSGSWLFQLNDPAFDPLRDDPRFDDLLTRLGLPTGEGG